MKIAKIVPFSGSCPFWLKKFISSVYWPISPLKIKAIKINYHNTRKSENMIWDKSKEISR